MQLAAILHNIRSVHNVGSIFRTADAAGISRIILSGYTPTPLDRFGRERRDFAKVSLGAERTIPWKQVKTLRAAISELRKEGYTIAGIEQHENAASLFEWKPNLKRNKIGIVLGNEVRGIAKSSLTQMDVILEIPMHGKKESLNVSVAAGIVMFVLINA
jgi:tRNA G18 (ribose-2'-O)-methylase SpoU